MKNSVTSFALSLMLSTSIFFGLSSPVEAQSTSYSLKKLGNYTVNGTISLTKANNLVDYSAKVTELPDQIPSNGTNYLLWGLTPDGKADNLGPISNSVEKAGTLKEKVTQFFITAEKDRFPDFVNGPRLAQSDTINQDIFKSFVTPSPLATSTPTTAPTASAPPIGGPTGAPETGLGGAQLWNAIIISLGGIGATGLILTIKNKLKAK